MINAHVLTDGYLHRVTRWPSQCRWPVSSVGGARAQGSPPLVRGRPVISITAHTSTLKQPSPPPSPSPMADTPRTVPAVLPRSPRARTTARALHSVIHGAFVHFQCFHARASIPITLTCFIVLLCRCISFRSSLHSFILLASTCSCFQCFHMLVLAYPSHSRCYIVVSLYLVVSLYRCVVVCDLVVSLYLVVSRGLVLQMYLARACSGALGLSAPSSRADHRQHHGRLASHAESQPRAMRLL